MAQHALDRRFADTAAAAAGGSIFAYTVRRYREMGRRRSSDASVSVSNLRLSVRALLVLLSVSVSVPCL